MPAASAHDTGYIIAQLYAGANAEKKFLKYLYNIRKTAHTINSHQWNPLLDETNDKLILILPLKRPPARRNCVPGVFICLLYLLTPFRVWLIIFSIISMLSCPSTNPKTFPSRSIIKVVGRETIPYLEKISPFVSMTTG